MFFRGRDRRELAWLLIALAAGVLLLAFILLAGEVTAGDTQAFDVRVLHALRRADDPSRPIGPAWLEGMFLDVTALGSGTVLGLLVLSVAGFLVLQGRHRTAAFVVISSASAWWVDETLKLAFMRARPEAVPQLRAVFSPSFPSGHALISAVVFLTLGAVLMRIAHRRATKIYCLAMAMILTLLVGVSRVFLGVHYPTDVLAGWIVGLAWASICWLVERRLERV